MYHARWPNVAQDNQSLQSRVNGDLKVSAAQAHIKAEITCKDSCNELTHCTVPAITLTEAFKLLRSGCV